MDFWPVLLTVGFFALVLFLVRKYAVFGGGRAADLGNLQSSGGRRDTNTRYLYGVAERQGRRMYMEDRCAAVGNLGNNPSASYFGVYDGHGGAQASEYCIQNVHANLEADGAFAGGDVGQGLKNAFMKTDRDYLKLCDMTNSDDGTTAMAMVTTDTKLTVANAGDCRAVLVRQSGEPVALSSDHKPNRPDERKRIIDLGGRVVLWGVWRVEGVLAVSRAIGDRALKAYVTPEPEIREWDRTDNDQFVVLASDGVW